MSFDIDLAPLLLSLTRVMLGVVLLMVARVIKGLLSPYRMDQELTANDNPAFGLAIAGYYLASVAVFIGAVQAQAVPLDQGTGGVVRVLALDLALATGGILALAASRSLMDRALVAKACISDQIVQHRNVAAGAVEAGVYLASGLVLFGALREPGGSLLTTATFFVLSQVVLVLFGRMYQRLAGYDVAREIQAGNLAAGIAFALTLIALALLMVKATSGEFIDWTSNLTYFAFDSLVGFILLIALRWITDLALLPNARIADEIVRDRNVNVGLVEGVLAVGLAALILFVF
jgi:uncharacterized membrane protein YjfL (UPF0719 family)